MRARRELIRRLALLSLAVALLVFSSACAPEPPKRVARVAVLANASFDRPEFRGELRQELRELGWAEGDNLILYWHYAGGSEPWLPAVADELVRSADVVIAGHGPAAVATLRASDTIPIVLLAHPDPVAGGLVASLDRPGGTITGNGTTPSGVIFHKRVEILKETVPRMARLGVLLDPGFSVASTVQLPAVVVAAERLGLEVVVGEARRQEEVPEALDTLVRDGANAVLVLTAPALQTRRKEIVAFFVDAGLPALCGWVDEGCLMYFGSNSTAGTRSAAAYVDKILRGAKPADLPIVQPTVFDFEVNLRTAEALGLTFPPSIAVQVTRWVDS